MSLRDQILKYGQNKEQSFILNVLEKQIFVLSQLILTTIAETFPCSSDDLFV